MDKKEKKLLPHPFCGSGIVWLTWVLWLRVPDEVAVTWDLRHLKPRRIFFQAHSRVYGKDGWIQPLVCFWMEILSSLAYGVLQKAAHKSLHENKQERSFLQNRSHSRLWLDLRSVILIHGSILFLRSKVPHSTGGGYPGHGGKEDRDHWGSSQKAAYTNEHKKEGLEHSVSNRTLTIPHIGKSGVNFLRL